MFRLAITIVTALLLLTAAVTLGGCVEKVEQKRDAADTTQAEPVDSVSVEYTGVAGQTVFDLLLAEHDVDYQESSAGVFVRGIDSVVNCSDHFWLYSVNDSMAQKAADAIVTADGDRVRWFFRRIGP